MSNDPEFEPKMLDVVGLYMKPPKNAVVLSVDEKTSIQALDRTQPRLSLKPHKIERLSHEYKRNGTASLLAALEVHSGQVQGQSIRRNNSDTFIRFLRKLLQSHPEKELHVVVDNGSSHRSKKTRAWVARHKRLHLHFTPTHASWLNQIEIWFGILTRKVVRRGSSDPAASWSPSSCNLSRGTIEMPARSNGLTRASLWQLEYKSS